MGPIGSTVANTEGRGWEGNRLAVAAAPSPPMADALNQGDDDDERQNRAPSDENPRIAGLIGAWRAFEDTSRHVRTALRDESHSSSIAEPLGDERERNHRSSSENGTRRA